MSCEFQRTGNGAYKSRVINPSGNSTALTVTPNDGGTHKVSATLYITRLD